MYYGRYRDTVGDQQWQQQFDYNAYRDSVADSQWQQQYSAGLTSDSRKLAQNQVDAILQAGGTPSSALLQQAGYSSEYAAALMAYYNKKNTPSYEPEPTVDPTIDENHLAMAKRQIDGERTYEGKLGELKKWFENGTITEAELGALLDYIEA
jgi:hypothetical protein